MIGLDLGAIENLAVIWIINPRAPLGSKPNLAFGPAYFSFYCKFCTFRIILFYVVSFLLFHLRTNKSYTHTHNMHHSEFPKWVELRDFFSPSSSHQ